MADLKTNYVDDKLDTSKNQLRKYNMITNDDGTVSFVDVTNYTTVGTNFGAKDINDTNSAINQLNTDLSALNESLVQNYSELNLKMDSANSNISKKQDASTAITTSNIGSQSVNYANSSNYANSANSANAWKGKTNIVTYEIRNGLNNISYIGGGYEKVNNNPCIVFDWIFNNTASDRIRILIEDKQNGLIFVQKKVNNTWTTIRTL